MATSANPAQWSMGNVTISPGSTWVQTPPRGVVSRIRLEGSGETPDALKQELDRVATALDQILPGVSRGTEVYERDENEPFASVFAYKGRLLLYAPIGVTDAASDPPGPAPA